MTEAKRQARIDQVERIAIGIATSGGLVAAACISALPATICTAMAETYGKAISMFGGAAIVGLLVLATTPPMKGLSREGEMPSGPRLVVFCIWTVSMFMMIYLFLAGIASGPPNLRLATANCYFGTSAELAEQVHKRIPLFGPLDWWRVFGPAGDTPK